MTEPASLLYPLFDALRRNGVPLGVEDYLLALRTLRSGAGIESADRLRAIIRLLWTKSRRDQEIFDGDFDRFVAQRLIPPTRTEVVLPESESLEVPAIPPEKPDSETSDAGSDDTPKAEPKEPSSAVGLPALEVVGLVEAPLEAGPRRSITYQLIPRPPISEREIASIWRHLRRMNRQGPEEELDAEGTIEEICRTGVCLRHVLRPRRRNVVNLLVLVDRAPAMEAFSLLVESLIEGIRLSEAWS